MTSMTNSADPSPETKEAASHEQLHPGAKVGLWLLVVTMAIFALGNLRDLIVAITR